MNTTEILRLIKKHCCRWCPRMPPPEDWIWTLDYDGDKILVAEHWEEKALRKLEGLIEDYSDINLCQWMLEDAEERQIPKEYINKRRRALRNAIEARDDLKEAAQWLRIQINEGEKNA